MDVERTIVIGKNVRAHRPERPVLFMTATLKPPHGAVRRSSYEARLSDYLSALRFYLQQPSEIFDRIIFADNSFAGIQTVEEVAKCTAHDKIVEIISFPGNDHPVTLGKEYGEFKLIDNGLKLSSICQKNDLIWKITGRLKFLNISTIQKYVESGSFDIVCDLHNVPLVGSNQFYGNRYMDLRTFAVRRQAYDEVYFGAWERIERFDRFAMYKLTMEARRKLRVLPRFPYQPRLQGISGRHLRDYDSPSERMKSLIRGPLRKVAPFLWI